MDLAMKNLPGTYIILCGTGQPSNFLFKYASFDGVFIRFREDNGGLGQLIPASQLYSLIEKDRIGIAIPLPLKDLFEDLNILVEKAALPINYEEEPTKFINYYGKD